MTARGVRRETPEALSIAFAVPRDLAGARHDVPVHAGETIIDAGPRAGLKMSHSCRGGICCTRRAKVTQGDVVMDTNYSLEPWELEAGYVLTCQSHLTTPVVAHFTSPKGRGRTAK